MSDTDTLREAAAVLQGKADATPIELTVADWLIAEAATVEAIPPLYKLVWGVDIEFTNGLSSVIQIGENEDGTEQLRSSSTPHGLAVAVAVLNDTHRADGQR